MAWSVPPVTDVAGAISCDGRRMEGCVGPECCQPMLSLTAGQPLTPVMGPEPWRWRGQGIGSGSEWRTGNGVLAAGQRDSGGDWELYPGGQGVRWEGRRLASWAGETPMMPAQLCCPGVARGQPHCRPQGCPVAWGHPWSRLRKTRLEGRWLKDAGPRPELGAELQFGTKRTG